MARSDTWMPLYWGDYLRDTGHLDVTEHGAYLLLIGHYWTTGKPLPDDDGRLGKIVRASPAQWKKLRPVIAEFFDVLGGEWRHGRIDAELARAIRVSDARQEAGKRGGKASAKRKQLIEQLVERTSTHAGAQPSQPHSQPPSPENNNPPLPTEVPPPPASDECQCAVERWNAFAEQRGLARVQVFSPDRRQKVAARLREGGGLDGWEAALERIDKTARWMLGDNDRGWRVDFDFLLQPSRFRKLMEGAYDRPVNGTSRMTAAERALQAMRTDDDDTASPAD